MKPWHLAASLSLAVAACSSMPAPGTGLLDGRLQPCPAAPHCVNSAATDERHRVAPLALPGDGRAAWQTVVAAVAASERTTVVEDTGQYLRAEVLSPWHVYTDDLELLWVPESARIDVRSSSRVGYYDFNVNRERVEALRARLVQQGVVRP